MYSIKVGFELPQWKTIALTGSDVDLKQVNNLFSEWQW